jgi:hypothetical protein
MRGILFGLLFATAAQPQIAVLSDDSPFRTQQPVQPASSTVTLTYDSGWNLISLPFIAPDPSLLVLFPDAISAFEYSLGYQLVSQLAPCEGYWLNLATGGTYMIAGAVIDSCGKSLATGWSLVGVPTTGVVVDDIVQIPGGNIISIFVFDSRYQYLGGQDVLPAGSGFWFNLAEAGQLTLIGQALGHGAVEIVGTVEEQNLIGVELMGLLDRMGRRDVAVLGTVDSTTTGISQIVGTVDQTGHGQVLVTGTADTSRLGDVAVMGLLDLTDFNTIGVIGVLDPRLDRSVEVTGSLDPGGFREVEIIGDVDSASIRVVDVVADIDRTGYSEVAVTVELDTAGVAEASIEGTIEEEETGDVEITGTIED